jgi:hypothetical protein
MSKERELLKRVIQDAHEGTMSLSLHNEISDYLDQTQPEQKREPLSEAEILNLYQDFSKTTFVELVRQIEKAHGIGVK